MYPDKAFSDIILDREGSYWLTTLQNGMLRIPNIESRVWNTENFALENDKIKLLKAHEDAIYFATIDGSVGRIDRKNWYMQLFLSDVLADVQSLDIDKQNNSIWFNINNILYELNKGVKKAHYTDVPAIKDRMRVGKDIFYASSHGTYLNQERISEFWATQILATDKEQRVWVSSHHGLMVYRYQNNSWEIDTTLLPGIQIVAMDLDTVNQQMYVLDYSGKIYVVGQDKQIDFLDSLPSTVRVYQIKVADNQIYVASNLGLWISNTENTATWKRIDSTMGLASDNIQNIALLPNEVWLVTDRGLQVIPMHQKASTARALIYVKNLNKLLNANGVLNLAYKERLVLEPEISNYAGNGQFSYAYRINHENDWTILPGSIEQIEIPNFGYCGGVLYYISLAIAKATQESKNDV